MYKAVFDAQKIGDFPTFSKAFLEIQKIINDIFKKGIPDYIKETCWIKGKRKKPREFMGSTEDVITFTEAKKIIYENKLTP